MKRITAFFPTAYSSATSADIVVLMRAIFKQLGAEVEWDSKQETLFVKKGDLALSYHIGDMVVEPVGLAGLSPVRNGMEATECIRALLPAGTQVELYIR